MNVSHRFAIALCIAILLLTPCRALPSKQTTKAQEALGLPFEIKSEEKTDSSIDKWYIVTIVLDRVYYSKVNLERIFQYYSDKEPELARIVRVDVFADPKTYELSKQQQRWSDLDLSSSEESVEKKVWRLPHAHYQRECLNEYYFYSPDLEDPAKRETVVLKGELYGAPITFPCKIGVKSRPHRSDSINGRRSLLRV